MKKILIIFSTFFVLFSCNNNINERIRVRANDELKKALESEDFSKIKEILKTGIDVEDNIANSILLLASKTGFLEIVELILPEVSDINIKDEGNEMTPLSWAVNNGHFEIVKYLVENNADINTKEGLGFTPLMLAAFNGYYEIADYLISNEAVVDEKNNSSVTALYVAAGTGRLEIVKCLKKSGANINSQSDDGFTALMVASQFGYTDVVEYLISQGADVNLENNFGETALSYAKAYTKVFDNEKIIELLISNGAVDLKNIGNQE